eukprot:4871090-Pleurochrysis_carterae.AAC.1
MAAGDRRFADLSKQPSIAGVASFMGAEGGAVAVEDGFGTAGCVAGARRVSEGGYVSRLRYGVVQM